MSQNSIESYFYEPHSLEVFSWPNKCALCTSALVNHILRSDNFFLSTLCYFWHKISPDLSVDWSTERPQLVGVGWSVSRAGSPTFNQTPPGTR